jgi:hypothetical protein
MHPESTIALSLLHEEWQVQYDGEPKMGGGFHVLGTHVWRRLEDAEMALKVLNQTGKRPSIRIAHRWATEWVEVS